MGKRATTPVLLSCDISREKGHLGLSAFGSSIADSFKLAASIYIKAYHITDHAIFLLLPSLALLWMIVWSGTKGIVQAKIHLRHLSVMTLEVTKHPCFHTLTAQGFYFSTLAAKQLRCH